MWLGQRQRSESWGSFLGARLCDEGRTAISARSEQDRNEGCVGRDDRRVSGEGFGTAGARVEVVSVLPDVVAPRAQRRRNPPTKLVGTV